MFTSIRKRITFANVVMTLALIFAMAGGAYAAKHYVISSVKQIKPSVVAQLKGKHGANGANGAPGANGVNGKDGTNGKDGAQGIAGTSVTSKPVPAKATGACAPQGGSEFIAASGTTFACNGKDGETGFTETLPSEKTETGGWTVSASAPGIALAPLSFSIPLAAELSESRVHYVTLSESNGHTAPAECPGSVADPTAMPGNLCVYEFQGANVKLTSVAKLAGGGSAGANKSGAFLLFEAEAEEPRIAWGSYAVTAP